MHGAMGLGLFIEVPISPSCEPGKDPFVGMYRIKRRRCNSPKSTWDRLREWGCGGSTAAEKRSWPVPPPPTKKKTLGRGGSVGAQELQRCNCNTVNHTSTTDLPKPNDAFLINHTLSIFLTLDVFGFVNFWGMCATTTVLINSSDLDPKGKDYTSPDRKSETGWQHCNISTTPLMQGAAAREQHSRMLNQIR